LKPDYAEAFYNRGGAYEQNGQYELAVADYDQAIRLKPNDGAALVNRCWTRAVMGSSLDNALEDCTEALKLKQDNAVTFDTRALVELRMGKYQEALADYERALQKSPKLASALFGRGIVELRTGNAARGEADLAAAEAAKPGTIQRFGGYGVTP
jgi:tetratricopeptide (TPR) repeat protein